SPASAVPSSLVLPLDGSTGHGPAGSHLCGDRLCHAVHGLAGRMELVRAACLLVAGAVHDWLEGLAAAVDSPDTHLFDLWILRAWFIQYYDREVFLRFPRVLPCVGCLQSVLFSWASLPRWRSHRSESFRSRV